MKLRMNSTARRYVTPEQRAELEAAIPDDFFVTIMYGRNPGDWSVRLFTDAGVKVGEARHRPTIVEPALHLLAGIPA